MEYLTISQATEKWKISDRCIQVLCSQNRIPGAYQLGRIWAIPADATKPVVTGNIMCITRRNNARERISGISRDTIRQYLDLIGRPSGAQV